MNQLRDGLDWPKLARQANWCVRTLAQQLKVSISTLQRYFHEHLWQCPHVWMRDERLRQSCVLLAGGQMTVQEVSIELSFQNQHHFSFAFKTCHGYPPKEHRKRIEDGRLRMADGGRKPADGAPASKNGVPRRSEAEAGTRNARIMPAGKRAI